MFIIKKTDEETLKEGTNQHLTVTPVFMLLHDVFNMLFHEKAESL